MGNKWVELALFPSLPFSHPGFLLVTQLYISIIFHFTTFPWLIFSLLKSILSFFTQ